MTMEQLPSKTRESGIGRIAGVEEIAEQELLGYFKRQFERDQRGSIEQEHTPELEELITEINEKMEEFMAKYGIQFLGIPARNIHVIDKSKLDPQQLTQLEGRDEKVDGVYLPNRQQIGVIENYMPNKKLHFTQILIHEMIHANSFGSMQKVKEGGIELTKGDESIHLETRRSGFEIYSARTGRKFFSDINEAITEELAIRFDQSYFSQFEELKQEYEERKGAREANERVKNGSGKNRRGLEFLIANLEHLERKEGHSSHEVVLRPHAYSNERKELNQLINDLYEKNKDEFQSLEDVFTLFAKATLNGRLLSIARLVEKTYGKGSFREIGEKSSKND